jgi:hypothetical protein
MDIIDVITKNKIDILENLISEKNFKIPFQPL